MRTLATILCLLIVLPGMAQLPVFLVHIEEQAYWLQYRGTDGQTRGRISENLIAAWRSTTHIPATKLKLDRMVTEYEACAAKYDLYRVVSTNGVP